MKIGTIINYYRKQKGWTQAELGNGICSDAHLSKIENDTTKFSPETINLLCDRLGIRAEDEMMRFKNVNSELHKLHERLVKQQMQTVKTKLNELSNSPFIHMDNFRPFFLLIRCRYYLRVGDMKSFNSSFTELDKNYADLQKFECAMKEHVMGISESVQGNYSAAIEHLMNIAPDEYPNHEFYYHLAGASYFINDHGKVHFYAKKALEYFKQTNNFRRVIDTEILLLLHMETNGIYNFDETIEKYQNLIQTCDIYEDYWRKFLLTNNLASLYFKNKEFVMAQTAFQEAKILAIEIDNSKHYVSSLIGEIHSRLWQNTPVTEMEKEKWSRLIEEGISLSKENETNRIFFKLLTFLLKDQKDLYYECLYKELIPLLKIDGNLFKARFYSKETYQYYLSIEKLDIAAKVAMSMVDEDSF